jgi:hypothetical protein
MDQNFNFIKIDSINIGDGNIPKINKIYIEHRKHKSNTKHSIIFIYRYIGHFEYNKVWYSIPMQRTRDATSFFNGCK